jgi:YD repeat-containing protein
MSRKARWLAEWRTSSEKPNFYHVVSRVVERRFAFGSAEKEKFRALMRMQEKFTGCRVVAHAKRTVLFAAFSLHMQRGQSFSQPYFLTLLFRLGMQRGQSFSQPYFLTLLSRLMQNMQKGQSFSQPYFLTLLSRLMQKGQSFSQPDTRALLMGKVYADGKFTRYSYTPGGRLASRTWARGVSTTYTYTQGLLTLTDYSDTTPDVAITYDGYGRQSTVTQASQSRITYSYNPTNLTLASELVNYDLDHDGTYEFTRTLDRSRDSLLRDSGYSLKTANSTLETSAAYSYSATDGRISQISNPLIPNQIFTYSYLPSSNLLSTVSGPIHTVTNTWEPNRDVLDLKQNKVGTSVISSYDYAVNAIGQRTGVSTSGTAFPAVPSWSWSYDALGQVIAADSTVATSDRSYQYDTIGNRQKSANSLTLPVANNYSANLLNQYSAINNQQSSVINPSYDFDGNATAYPVPVAPATNGTLTWDAENRLISSTVGTATTTYQYDAQSRRIAKVAGTSATTSTATLYLYDAWNCLAEYERGTGVSPVLTLKKTRLWGTDLSGTPQGAGGVSGLLSESHISNPPCKRTVLFAALVLDSILPSR